MLMAALYDGIARGGNVRVTAGSGCLRDEWRGWLSLLGIIFFDIA